MLGAEVGMWWGGSVFRCCFGAVVLLLLLRKRVPSLYSLVVVAAVSGYCYFVVVWLFVCGGARGGIASECVSGFLRAQGRER